MSMKKGFISLVLALLMAGKSYAQVDSSRVKNATLTLAAIYGNNADYYGQTAEERLPYVLTNASLRLKSGFYFSAGSYKLLNTGSSAISAVDLSAGFETDITKNLSGSFGYTRSFYAQNSPLLQASNENALSASLGYDFNFLNTSLSTSYAFGTQQDLFMSFNASKSIDLGSLFSDKDFISLEPGIELVGGTLHYLEEYIVRRERQFLQPINPKFPNREQEYILTRDASSFDMLSYSTNLALGYNRSNYLVEAAWQLSALGKNVSETRKPRSFFNLSFYYQF